jgi:hypothetical protein
MYAFEIASFSIVTVREKGAGLEMAPDYFD